MGPDWRLFPPELLQLISEKLPSIVDYVRFRAVCPAWRSASSPRPLRLPQQLPWLILPRITFLDLKEATLESSISLYDLSQSKTHTLHLPEILGKRICGSSHGWLVLEKDRKVYLFNPITRDQVRLPSLSSQPNFFLPGYIPERDVLEWRTNFCIRKAILSSSPSLDPNCLVMAQFSGPWDIAFCRIDDDCWTVVLLNEQQYSPSQCIVDIVYNNDLFYLINHDGLALKCDIRKHFSNHIRSTLRANEAQVTDYICPVEGAYNEHALMIWDGRYEDIEEDPIHMFSIHMLSHKQEIWSDVKEQLRSSCCFFFGGNYHCISLPLASLQLHGWEGNCMCYTSPQLEERIDDVDWHSCSIKLYKLNDQTVTTLASHLGFFRWLKYQEISRSPYFLWLTPSLC